MVLENLHILAKALAPLSAKATAFSPESSVIQPREEISRQFWAAYDAEYKRRMRARRGFASG